MLITDKSTLAPGNSPHIIYPRQDEYATDIYPKCTARTWIPHMTSIPIPILGFHTVRTSPTFIVLQIRSSTYYVPITSSFVGYINMCLEHQDHG